MEDEEMRTRVARVVERISWVDEAMNFIFLVVMVLYPMFAFVCRRKRVDCMDRQ